MAETLYLKDGTVEVLVNAPAAHLRELIEERLGRDCAQLFEKLMVHEDPEADEWERIADGFCSLCLSTSEELAGLMEKMDRRGRRMTKRDIRDELDRIRDELISNL